MSMMRGVVGDTRCTANRVSRLKLCSTTRPRSPCRSTRSTTVRTSSGSPVGLELDERAGGRRGAASAVRNSSSVGIRSPAWSRPYQAPTSSRRSVGEVEVADRARVAGDALERRVVEEHRHAVAAELHVGLDEREVVHRELERRHRVLGRLRAVAAVPDDEGGVARQPQRTEDVDRRRRRGGRRDEQGRGGHDRAGEGARRRGRRGAADARAGRAGTAGRVARAGAREGRAVRSRGAVASSVRVTGVRAFPPVARRCAAGAGHSSNTVTVSLPFVVTPVRVPRPPPRPPP